MKRLLATLALFALHHAASTETMVLRSTSAGWKIVHIHWSSRAKDR